MAAMNDTRWRLAQFNVARMRGPVDGPVMAEFVANLDRINELAERSEGFVWRLQSDEGDATSFRPFADDILVNLSVWENPDSLAAFVYRSGHVDIMRRRREWFEQLDDFHSVLWWIPVGKVPNLEEASNRLTHLRTHGPSPHAFTFRDMYRPDGALAQEKQKSAPKHHRQVANLGVHGPESAADNPPVANVLDAGGESAAENNRPDGALAKERTKRP